jgi:hypothetical protein
MIAFVKCYDGEELIIIFSLWHFVDTRNFYTSIFRSSFGVSFDNGTERSQRFEKQ